MSLLGQTVSSLLLSSLSKTFHETLVPMQVLNTEHGIDFGFNSSRFCKFKDIYFQGTWEKPASFFVYCRPYADWPK